MLITRSTDILAPAKSSAPKPVDLLLQLVDCLHSEGIRYCHWKSNFHLLHALSQAGGPTLLLSGELDLDLLVDRRDIARFEGVLALTGFKRALDPTMPHTPSVFHFYGHDPATGGLLHLHVYYRILTGESLLKNLSLSLEELLLSNVRKIDGLALAHPRAELVIFIVRMMVKYASLAEQLLIGMDDDKLLAELEWLLAHGPDGATERLVQEWLPSVPLTLFRECVSALGGRASRMRLYHLGRRLRRALIGYRRFSYFGELVRRAEAFCKRGLWRLVCGRGSRKDLASGGAVIAFIGIDPSENSWLMRETASWLGKVFRVDKHHLGKPPSAWMTLLPNLARRLLAWAAPDLRKSTRHDSAVRSGKRGGLLYRLRMVMLAWDRRALAARMHHRAANGWIILCERYPSAEVGSMDGTSLAAPAAKMGGRLRGYLARLEDRLYRQIASPDIVIRVVTSANMAVERNGRQQEMVKEKSASYMACNHRHVRLPSFPNARTAELNTNRSRAETVQDLRRILWQLL